MALLQFQLDKDVVNQERGFDILETDAGVLLHLRFVMPVRLRVGDVELLERTRQYYQQLWIVDPDTGVHIPIEQLRQRLGDFELFEKHRRFYEQVWIEHPETGTLLPIQYKVDRPPWRSLPILHVASEGLECVKEAEQAGRSRYSVPDDGYLHFEIVGHDVVVHGTDIGRTGRDGYEVVLSAFEQFASEVRRTVKREIPELMGHPYWGEWLRQVE